MSASSLAESTAYCAEALCRQDHERYLTCLFAPADKRAGLFALYAFNLEVAKTAEVVSEAMLGRIRLQWWRDAIDGIYAARPQAHAVIEPLAAAVAAHRLSRAHFDRLIDGREADLDLEEPADMPALETYARDISATLSWLALEVLGAGGDDTSPTAQAAESVGIAWSLTGLLRAVPFHAARKQLFLPADAVRESGLKTGDLFELRSSAPLCQIVAKIAARAEEHLAAGWRHRRQVPRTALPALWPATLAAGHLATLRRAGYDPFDPRVQRRPAGSAWRLAWARLLGRY